jgi:hypothetical protein
VPEADTRKIAGVIAAVTDGTLFPSPRPSRG